MSATLELLHAETKRLRDLLFSETLEPKEWLSTHKELTLCQEVLWLEFSVRQQLQKERHHQ